MAAPEVSVVVLPRGRPAARAATLASVRAQRDVEVEVIDLGVRPLDSPSLARNEAAAGGRAPWLAFLDEGDLWAPDRLRRQIDLAERERAGFAYAGRVVVSAEAAPLDLALPADPAYLADRLRHDNAVGSASAVLIRRDAFPGFDERLRVYDDWQLWAALAARERAAVDADFLTTQTWDDRRPELVAPRRAIDELRMLRGEGRLATNDRDELMQLAAELRAHGYHREAAWAYADSGRRHRRPQDLVRAAAALRPAPAAPLEPTWLAPRWLEELAA